MIAVIPTIGEAYQLPGLVQQLLFEGVEQVLLTVNRPGVTVAPMLTEWSQKIVLARVDGTIYDGWNYGLRRAYERNTLLAVLNDDIELEPWALGRAEMLMRSDPTVAICGLDYTEGSGDLELKHVHGTFQHGGIPGWAFLADPERVGPVDPQFEWWYGDDDLVNHAEKDGWKVAIAMGCKVKHQGEATASKPHHSWTTAAKVRDTHRYHAKWGADKETT